MHVSPVAVIIRVTLNRVLSVELIPIAVPLILPLIVELPGLSVVADVVLGGAVGVGILCGRTIRPLRRLPVHVDLLELLEGLILPGIEGLCIGPRVR